MEAIEVSHLTFSYDGKNDILKDVSFSIPKGSYTTIIGHNGSGKSTMAKLIIGLLEAKKGKIQILGQELNEESVYELRSHIELYSKIQTINLLVLQWQMILPLV